MADTKLAQFVVNELTKAQYEAATKQANQFYAVTDEPPLCRGDNISGLTNDAGFITLDVIKGLPGYDATKTQTLKHVQGVLQWVDGGP